MKSIPINDVEERWDEIEKLLAADNEVVLSVKAKPVAKLVPLEPPLETE
jgi:hypothetical protein